MLVRTIKKVGNTQLEVVTMTHLDSVGVLTVDQSCLLRPLNTCHHTPSSCLLVFCASTVAFPSLGRRWAALKPECSIELFVHEENKENPVHVLSCFAAPAEAQQWFADFTDAKNRLIPQEGLVPIY